MRNNRRWLGVLMIGIGVVSLMFTMRGWGRWEGEFRGRQRGFDPPQAIQQPAQNTSPDYLRGYADGLEAARQTGPQIGPQDHHGRFGRHDGHGGPLWLAFCALPLLAVGGLLLFRRHGRHRPWGRGHRRHRGHETNDYDDDHDEPVRLSRAQRDQPPYTNETHRL